MKEICDYCSHQRILSTEETTCVYRTENGVGASCIHDDILCDVFSGRQSDSDEAAERRDLILSICKNEKEISELKYALQTMTKLLNKNLNEGGDGK